jgi:Restriction Enzyme Adenine Methylase Associated/Protein of unknown function (DUF2924)
MAIQDRNLSVGTKLYARYKGETYHAEVVAREGGTAYRLSDGREFKSPSAAGTAITGKACNGWAFWSVGDGAESTGPVRSTSTRAPRAKAQPAPKPQPRRRARKTQSDEPPASDTPDEPHSNGADFGNPGDVHPEGIVCAACGETFPTVEAATEHYYATHGKPEGDEPTA